MWGRRPGCRAGGWQRLTFQRSNDSPLLCQSLSIACLAFRRVDATFRTAMKPQHTLGRATTPDGRELILHERDGAYAIRVDGLELMSSRAHGSEEG